MKKISITERGWAGHYILANRCRFRRNTLIEYKDIKIVVSTVGLHEIEEERFGTLGANGRYFETMAFHSDPTDVRYHDIDTSRKVDFYSPWCIKETDADDMANIMHDNVVQEICDGLVSGKKY